MSMRPIAARLFLAAVLWSAGLLIVAGVVIAALYRTSLETAFDQRLNVYMRAIVADIAAGGEDTRTEPGQLGEPQFELPLSGWYWQITRLDGGQGDIKASRSLAASKLPKLAELDFAADAQGMRSGNVSGPAAQTIHILERQIDVGDDGLYLVQIAAPVEEMEHQFHGFVLYLIITLGVLGGALIGLSALQVRYGLRPLHILQAEVSAIRRGESEGIRGVFPSDVQPLASELNLMIGFNREILQRARTQVGNLAHALKTPLSVIMNEMHLDTSSAAPKVIEQVEVMRQHLTYYLDRARTAARYNVIGASAEVTPMVEALVRTFEKICRDRDLTFALEINTPFVFRGERQDFEEMVGNLLDNACKWARSRIVVRLEEVEKTAADDLNGFFVVIVDDDGPGLPADLYTTALLRGGRLDESKPGSGLGLSIVVDVARLYGGALELGQGPLGGLRARLRLPRI